MITDERVVRLQQILYPGCAPAVVHFLRPIPLLEYLFGQLSAVDFVAAPRHVDSVYGKLYFGKADADAFAEKFQFVSNKAGPNTYPFFFGEFSRLLSVNVHITFMFWSQSYFLME